MPVTIDGTNGITNGGGYTGDGVSFADATPANTLVTTSAGNVGIGTSTPGNKLAVFGDIGCTNQILLGSGLNNENCVQIGAGRTGSGLAYIDLVGDTTYSDYGLRLIRYDTGPNTTSQLAHRGTGNLAITTEDAANIVFQTSRTDRMFITPSGEVIVGTIDRGAFNLQCNGTGVWGAGAYTNGSDARIKDDIEPIGSCLDVVNALNPVTFRYKPDFSKDQSLQPGFIAQELQTALADQPYLEGVVQVGPEYLSVAYQTLIPVLTKALQEANTKIDALEARLAAVEGAIA